MCNDDDCDNGYVNHDDDNNSDDDDDYFASYSLNACLNPPRSEFQNFFSFKYNTHDLLNKHIKHLNVPPRMCMGDYMG